MNSIFLLIEDNTIDQVVTAQLLRKMIGATQIFVVKNGIEAIEWLKKCRDQFCQPLVILLDVRMPEMNGFEFLDAYDELPNEMRKETSIYMLSSTLDPGDIQKAKQNKHVAESFSNALPVQKFKDLS